MEKYDLFNVMYVVHIFIHFSHVHTPCLALSSLYAEATSLNFWPSFNFAIASITFECFSHKICRTCYHGQDNINFCFPFFSSDNLVAHVHIVNRGDWLGSPANIKGANKDAKIYVGRSATLHNLLFCPHKLCMNYVTNTFYWLVPRSVVKNYCVLCRVKAKKENKNIQQRTLTSFITIPLY